MLGRKLLVQFTLGRRNTQVLTSQFQRLCHHETQATPGATPDHQKVYELRCYQVNVKDMKTYIEVTTDPGIKIRTKYSKLLGYWQSEYGGICNQVVHMWVYDSLQHRIQLRKGLTSDPAWISDYLSHVLPMWNFQENSLMRLLPWASIPSEVKDGGIYQLEKLTLTGDIGKEMGRIAEYGLAADEGTDRQLIGAWNVICGKLNTVNLLHRYGSQDAAIHHQTHPEKSKTAQAYKSMLPLTAAVESRILLPYSFSPWK
ncbi:protein NipSnap homolog 3A-like [Lineus longissimus]|uniref:protein NipSnap homolog 3A-like n=1 Tax=Lineus longissimus TaxID=88925 RepID=UPI002B4DF206